jgi:VIT1/CCC1 family predicted Fe2+/Mn2+ transporter
LDPAELGSPWGAALSSFVSFVIGAVIPVLAYLFASGQTAFVASMVLSAAGLLAVGALISRVTGRNTALSALRMLFIGSSAAAITYGVGSLVGVTIAH